MNFDDWKAGAKEVSIAEGAEVLGMLESDFERAENVILFPTDLYALRMADGDHWTIVGRSEHTGTLDEVAGFLFCEMYVPDRLADHTFRENDGTLDVIVGDMITAHPGIDENADDWGGIMGLMFSDVTKTDTGWTGIEVYDTVSETVRIYGSKPETPPACIKAFGRELNSFRPFFYAEARLAATSRPSRLGSISKVSF